MSRWRRRVFMPRGFAARLAMATSGLILLACTSLSWILVRRDLQEIHRSLVERGHTISEYVAHEAELSTLSGDLDGLRQLAKVARAQRDVVYCRFFDAEGQELAPVGDSDGPQRAASAPVAASETSGPVPVDANTWEFESPIVTTDLRPQREELEFMGDGDWPHAKSAPQKRVGTVAIGLALAPLRAHLARSFLAAVFLTALVTLAAILSAVFYAKAITRPLEKLARAADAIAEGDLDTVVELHTGDEVNSVARSFNAMARSLAQSRSTLEEYSRTLEVRTERLEDVNRQLEEANRLKSEFMAQVSHELRTPLNVIIGYGGMLADGAGGPVTMEQSEMLETILRYSKQQLELVTDVLDLSRLASGKISFHVERFSLSTTLTDVIGPHRFNHIKSEVALELDVAADIPDLETDRVKLQEIIRNLVDNALKFTEQGVVVVEARRDADARFVVVEVRDTGLGIPPEDVPYVFDEFRQVGEGSTRGTNGVGLGLSIVKRLVAALGGTVSVTTRLGEGSCFRIRVPCRFQNDASQHAAYATTT